MRFGHLIITSLALAGVVFSPVRADVIWSGVQDIPLWWTGTNEIPLLPPFPPLEIALDLDVNMDTHADFRLGDIGGGSQTFGASCYGDNKVSIASVSVPFTEGIQIDATMNWGGGEYLLDQWYVLLGQQSGGTGPWHGMTGYMGLQFEAADGIHYGWVNMTVYDEFPGMTIHSWAYESTPGTGIIAGAVPEPSSVILAVLGAISAWNLRRCRQRSLLADEEK